MPYNAGQIGRILNSQSLDENNINKVLSRISFRPSVQHERPKDEIRSAEFRDQCRKNTSKRFKEKAAKPKAAENQRSKTKSKQSAYTEKEVKMLKKGIRPEGRSHHSMRQKLSWMARKGIITEARRANILTNWRRERKRNGHK